MKIGGNDGEKRESGKTPELKLLQVGGAVSAALAFFCLQVAAAIECKDLPNREEESLIQASSENIAIFSENHPEITGGFQKLVAIGAGLALGATAASVNTKKN